MYLLLGWTVRPVYINIYSDVKKLLKVLSAVLMMLISQIWSLQWLLILPAVWSSAPPRLTWSGGGWSLQSCWLNVSRNEGLCTTKLLQSSQSEITLRWAKLFFKYLLMGQWRLLLLTMFKNFLDGSDLIDSWLSFISRKWDIYHIHTSYPQKISKKYNAHTSLKAALSS